MIINENKLQIKKDCHHNSDGKVDYSPMYGATDNLEPIPLDEQRYDFKYEANREQAATTLATTRRCKYIDWEECERIIDEYN